MAETQAKSGTTGTSIDPVELNVPQDEHDGSDQSIDRAAVGRASVPVDSPATAMTDRSSIDDELIKIEKSATDPASGMNPTAPAVGPISRSSSGAVGTASAAVGRGTAPASLTRKPPARPAGSAPVDGSSSSAGTGAARVAEAVRSARATVSSAAGRGPRRARLFVKRIDPWSVMKFSFAVSFVLFFVLVVATSVLYLMLDQMNVFSSVNKALAQIVGSNTNIKVTAGAVIGAAGAMGLVMVVLVTALSTLGAFIYNVCADLVGGIEVTLSEKE
jgi:Transmembrane domain of unknown function (DUF3566)